MDFKIKYIVRFDKDVNMFQRKHFEKLDTLLRKNEEGDHLEIVDFEGCKLKKLDLSGLDLSNFNFKNGQLKNINFSNCNLSNVSFEKTSLIACNFNGAILKYSDLSHLNAEECIFTDAVISGSLRWMILNKCTFSNVNFGGILTGTDFSTCKMENNNYEKVEMSGLIFPYDKYLP